MTKEQKLLAYINHMLSEVGADIEVYHKTVEEACAAFDKDIAKNNLYEDEFDIKIPYVPECMNDEYQKKIWQRHTNKEEDNVE